MRCTNCGWNNPDGLTKCQKCGQPLELAPKKDFTATVRDIHSIPDVPEVRQSIPDDPDSRKATVRDVGAFIEEEAKTAPASVPASAGLKLVPVNAVGETVPLEALTLKKGDVVVKDGICYIVG